MELQDDSLPGHALSLEELERNPGRGIDVLEFCSAMSLNRENLRDPLWRERSLELKMDWLEARRPLTRTEAKRLLEETDDYEEYEMIQHWAGRHGRPITLRKAAIM